MQTNELIYAMLTENTGRDLCDSGDAYGRNWQRNAKKTLADFESEPSATLEVRKYTDREGKTRWEMYPTISLYHHLTDCLTLDDTCREFNGLPVENWDGDYYGVSDDGQEWLDSLFNGGECFNSYNWCANFSQVIQYTMLEHIDSGDNYVLLQIHGGCDVRGGYTDAKLFKLDCEEWGMTYESCGFWANVDGKEVYADWNGTDWTNDDGYCLDDDQMAEFCEALGEGVHAGDAFECV